MSDKLLYEVQILRRDQAHLSVLETDDFDKADKLWAELDQKWELCLKEQKPFKLRKPIITSFDPGLIYEITVMPITAPKGNPDNPYQQAMLQKGLGATLRGGSDMLDNGFVR